MFLFENRNIFVKNNNLKIGDFGSAKQLETLKNEANTFAGTISYISPQIINGQPYTHKTDVW